MKKCFVLFIGMVLISCTTIDVEKNVKSSDRSKKTTVTQSPAMVIVPIETEPVIVERPMYVPQGSTTPPPAQGRAAVQRSNTEGILQPQDYEKAVMVYDFHRDFVYQIYCQPVRVTDITLESGERIVDLPFISDSERWLVGAGFHYENEVPVQHVYVKPTAANLRASLIINTNVRVYHLILMSYADIHMPVVRFRYFTNITMPQNFIPNSSKSTQFVISGEDESIYTDPRYLSFNYKISHGVFRKPRWLPSMVYDDGRKTYIIFPESVLQTELPAVFEHRTDIVNYRVNQNIMIIDKLIEKVSIKLDKNTVTVEKKRGKK